jgi:hypothetical protein
MESYEYIKDKLISNKLVLSCAHVIHSEVYKAQFAYIYFCLDQIEKYKPASK